MVDGVGAAVGADGVAAADGALLTADDDGPAFGRILFSPVHGERVDAGLAWVGG